MTMLLALAAAATAMPPAHAMPSAEPVCIRLQPPPAGLEAWGKPIAATTDDALKPGVAASVTLADATKVRFAPPPSRATTAGSYGAAVPFRIGVAGTYRIALSAGAWIDVIGGGQPLKSVAHTTGEPCSGIRKIVDFTLSPGSYTLQLSAAASPALTILLARAK